MCRYTVIIRTHNETDELELSIKSVLGQTYRDWELVIIDDGSQWKTKEIANHYMDVDKRIRVIHQTNTGGLGAMRRGIKEAKGEFLAFLDAGDEYECNYLEEAEKSIVGSNESIDMVAFGLREVFPDRDRTYCLIEGERVFEPRVLIKKMEKTISFYGLAYKVTTRKAFRYTDEEEKFYDVVGKSGNFGDDLYLLSPILRNCKKIYVTDKPLYRYNYSENSLSHWFPKYTWEDAWNRNRLVGFTYKTLTECGFMDEELRAYMQRHATTLLAPCAKWIVKHRVEDKLIQKSFKNDYFFNQVVSRNCFGKEISGGFKSRAALMLFRCMTRR